MGKTCSEVKQKYRKTLAEGVYLNRNIDYSPQMDHNFVGEQYSFGTHVNETKPKVASLDLDDTVGKGPHLGELVDKDIGFYNRRIKPFVSDLIEYVRKISNPNTDDIIRKESRKKYCDILKDGRLHNIELDQASKEAAKEMKLVKNSENLVPALKRRGYIMRLSTGSPTPAAVYLGETKLNLPMCGVTREHGIFDLIDGTDFEFDSKGYFVGIRSGLDKKGESMLKFHRYYGSSHHLFVFFTDDYKSKSEREAASIAGLTIYSVDRSIFDRLIGFEYPGNIVLACPEAKDDTDVFVEKLDRWDRFNVQTWLINPKNQLALIELGIRFRESYENLVNAKEVLPQHKFMYLDSVRQIQGIVQSTNLKHIKNIDVYDLMVQLENSTTTETDKKICEDINSRFEAIPERKVSKKFAGVFKDVVNEAELFDEVEWMLTC